MGKYKNPALKAKKVTGLSPLHLHVSSGLITLLIVAGIGIPLSLKASTLPTNNQQFAAGNTGYTCQQRKGTCIPMKLTRGNCNTTAKLDCGVGMLCCDAQVPTPTPIPSTTGCLAPNGSVVNAWTCPTQNGTSCASGCMGGLRSNARACNGIQGGCCVAASYCNTSSSPATSGCTNGSMCDSKGDVCVNGHCGGCNAANGHQICSNYNTYCNQNTGLCQGPSNTHATCTEGTVNWENGTVCYYGVSRGCAIDNGARCSKQGGTCNRFTGHCVK